MIIGDGIVLGAGGGTASIFVTGLSETDTVTASKDGKTVVGKWVSNPNPAIVVPNGYTQLEYIESTGTQYIDFGVNVQPNIRMVSDVQLIEIANPGGDNIFQGGTYMSDFFSAGIFKNIGSVLAYFSNPSDETATTLSSFTEEVCKNRFSVDFDTYRKVFSAKSFDGAITQLNTFSSTWPESSSTITTGQNGVLFRRYSDKIYVGESLVRDCIPSKRNSDSAIGLYDLVNDVFYPNAGTGTFTAGPEVPQTIDGFEIAPIKSYGTWTVSNADSTKVADVLIDAAAGFEVTL